MNTVTINPDATGVVTVQGHAEPISGSTAGAARQAAIDVLVRRARTSTTPITATVTDHAAEPPQPVGVPLTLEVHADGTARVLPPVTPLPPPPEPEPVAVDRSPLVDATPAASEPEAGPVTDQSDVALTVVRRPTSPSVRTLELQVVDGSPVTVAGASVCGRLPVPHSDAEVVVLEDRTLSLSKTHMRIDFPDGGATLTDLRSSNGTTISRPGGITALTPGMPFPLNDGDLITVADWSATVSLTS